MNTRSKDLSLRAGRRTSGSTAGDSGSTAAAIVQPATAVVPLVRLPTRRDRSFDLVFTNPHLPPLY